MADNPGGPVDSKVIDLPRCMFLILILSGLLAACVTIASPLPASPLPASPLPASLLPASLLPASVYYLDGSAEKAQVWRLEADGFTTVQLTDEPGGVDDFAVSRADGSLAVVSDNRLVLQDIEGTGRRIVADASQVEETIEDYVFRGFVESPEFSPDGRTLAYAFDGLHLYDVETGQDAHVLSNLGNLLGEPFVFTKEAYSPGPWSPDGTMLLVIMGYFEGSTLAVMEPGTEPPFRRLWSDGPVCCVYNWTSDGRSVLVANPYFTTNLPGLWRYDTQTGEETTVVPGIAEDGSIHYAGWPLLPDSGDLLFFHANLERFSPDAGIPLVMVRSDPDGSNLTPVHPETFRLVDALWAPDGSLAVAVHLAANDRTQVTLARTDGSPLQVLTEGDRIQRLAWGP